MSLFSKLPLSPAGLGGSVSESGVRTANQPLAERMRPRTLDDFVGQEHLLGPGAPLRVLIETDRVQSMILWGPPGCGKTTLARLIAGLTRAAFDFFGQASAFVADEQRNGLAPIHFPWSEQRLVRSARFVDARSERVNADNFELREQNGKRHSGQNRKMQRGAGGSAKRFGRIRAGRAADAGSGSDRAGRAEGGGRAENRADVAGILHSGEHDEKRSTGETGSAHEIIETRFARLDQRRHTLRMLGVGEPFE